MADALFTCITCRVAFHDADTQRAHYKSDWHRYNLKRKVAEMPPVTAENFQQRVLAQREKVSEQEKTTSSHCQLCNKHFSSLNAYSNHLQSKKHKELQSKNEAEKVKADVDRKNEINKHKSQPRAGDKNTAKETSKKGTQPSIGEEDGQSVGIDQLGQSAVKAQERVLTELDDEDMVEDDSDAESWESFDGEGLGVEECLFCSQVSQSMEDNLRHMTVKHGFFLPDAEYISDLEGLISYLGQKVGEGNVCLWCNEKGRRFQSTQAVQRHMVDKGHCKMLHEGEAVLEYADFYDYRTSYPDFAESEGGAAASPGVGEEPMEEDEEEVDEEPLESDGYELVLPSGVTVGHRSLQRYYCQNLPQRRAPRGQSVMPRLLAQYKALGWTGIKGEAAVQKAKDLAEFRRLRHHHYMKLGVKANKLQHHFRCQVIF
ncbi:cytoplasmic 60S subunit biogenesis factor ZNF622-like isoform X2 [Liolophura sinensis]